jgi:integrase
MARERIMSARISLQARIDDYLAERRRLGFELRSLDTFLAGFARFVASRHHRGPLTIELMADWVRQGKGGRGSPGTWARRLEKLRLFARYLKQFVPDTEVPDESIFGAVPGRVAPHIYHEAEIVELLAAARKLGPRGSLRPATFETLFGLMASTGLRVSEAIHLRDADVDLKHVDRTADQVRQVTSVARTSQHRHGAGTLPAAACAACTDHVRLTVPHQQPWSATGAVAQRTPDTSCLQHAARQLGLGESWCARCAAPS